MSTKFKIKRSSVGGNTPNTADLDWGELAINYTDGFLYFKDSLGNLKKFSASNNPISTSSGTFDYLKLTGGTGDQGKLSWNPTSQTVDLIMNGNVTQQLGEELYAPLVKNVSGSTIPNGTPVSISGSDGTYFFVEKADASIHTTQHTYLGVTTEAIATGTIGRITYFGLVRGVDTSSYTVSDALYIDPSVAGGITNTRPPVDKHTIFIGNVQTVGVNGTILVRPVHEQDANDISYDNTVSLLTATDVQGAIDELQSTKADVSLLSSNITLYATTASSDVSGYYKLVTSTEDVSYNTTAVDVNTPVITTQDQLIASLAAPAGLFIGNPGILNIPTVGNIAKIAGNSNTYAEFYFRVYKRNSLGIESLVAESSTTGAVNPENLNTYYQFSASALLSNGSWTSSDRVVIKYYGTDLANGASQYKFQFGGSTPVRTQLPVPVSVVANVDSANIVVSTENFNSILSTSDSNVQSALDTLDDHKHDLDYLKLTGGSLTGHLQLPTLAVSQFNITATTATTNLDFSSHQNFYITLSNNTTFTVSGLTNRVGCSGILIIKQDATGGYQFTKATEMKTPVGGASIVQVTTANTLSTLSYYIVDSSTILVNYIGDFA